MFWFFFILSLLRTNKTALSQRHLDITYGGELENSKCSSLKTKDTTELETCKKIHFYVILHLLTIKIQQAQRVLILEFYDVTCKPAICLRTNGIAQSPVVQYCLSTFTPVVEESLALIYEDH